MICLRTLLVAALLLVPATGCGSADPDGGGPDAAPSADADPNLPRVSCEFQAGVEYQLLAETLQLASADGQTCVKLTRRDESEPDVIYKAVPFTLLTFRVAHGEETAFIDDLAALDWESTHHNWLDRGEALTETIRYELAFQYANTFEDSFELSAFAGTSTTLVWGPVTLIPHAD